MGKKIILFENKEDCCGCGACQSVCPKNAVSMKEDCYGFMYPDIDENLCVGCKKCLSVCAFKNNKYTNRPLSTYAGVSKNLSQARVSASGGVFAAIASDFLADGGHVFGASFTNDFCVAHRRVDSIEDLSLLQGSKYVQSKIGDSYNQVKDLLRNGEKVLFSGTPCQVDGLKAYLNCEYENLLTVDIICHGVPSEKMFKSYLQYIERKNAGKITSFTFRDKSLGWGINGKVVFRSQNGREKELKLWQSASSYLYYFTKGWIYRDNCYKCKYAGASRPGDITLGDYWGIEKQHPEYFEGNESWRKFKLEVQFLRQV